MFIGLILDAGPPTQPPPQNTQGAVVGSSVLDTPKEVVSVGASFDDELIEQVFLAKKESKAEDSGLSSSLKQEDKENSGLRFFF